MPAKKIRIFSDLRMDWREKIEETRKRILVLCDILLILIRNINFWSQLMQA
jgi:hypothetical protein